jgi:hypothetical protein
MQKKPATNTKFSRFTRFLSACILGLPTGTSFLGVFIDSTWLTWAVIIPVTEATRNKITLGIEFTSNASNGGDLQPKGIV